MESFFCKYFLASPFESLGIDKQALPHMPHFTHEFGTRTSPFVLIPGRTNIDADLRVLVTEFPSGVRDFQILRHEDGQRFGLLNPLELLGTQTACNVLEKLRQTGDSNVNSWILSRLLVQCLEYSHNRRHLVTNHWDESTLRGEELTQIASIDLASEQAQAQARDFQIVQAADFDHSELDADYWGTFTALPPVEDEFQSHELNRLCDALCGQTEHLRDQSGEIRIADLRRLISNLWANRFSDFDLPVAPRERRKLFRKLMSVAVRQSSTLVERIAFVIVLRNGSIIDRASSPFHTERERKLFELRYGACEALDGINIGFLYDCGELHADLINSLASSLVSADPDSEWQRAELELRKHVHLLGLARRRATEVEAEKKRQQREKYADGLPRPRIDINENEELITDPEHDESYIAELGERRDAVLPLLKPRDRQRLEPLLDSGDFKDAAEALGLTVGRYRRQLRETVFPNVQRVLEQLAEDED